MTRRVKDRDSYAYNDGWLSGFCWGVGCVTGVAGLALLLLWLLGLT